MEHCLRVMLVGKCEFRAALENVFFGGALAWAWGSLVFSRSGCLGFGFGFAISELGFAVSALGFAILELGSAASALGSGEIWAREGMPSRSEHSFSVSFLFPFRKPNQSNLFFVGAARYAFLLYRSVFF